MAIKISNKVGVSRIGLDTIALARSINNCKKKLSVLEIGVGTGYISIYLKKRCNFNVEGVDINKRAILLSKQNAERNNSKINFYLSDMFNNVNKKYDIVIFNPPILLFEQRNGLFSKLQEYIKYFFPRSFLIADIICSIRRNLRVRYLIKFVKKAKKHLKRNAEIYLVAHQLDIEYLKRKYKIKIISAIDKHFRFYVCKIKI